VKGSFAKRKSLRPRDTAQPSQGFHVLTFRSWFARGELASLTVEDFDLSTGELTFYRPKVDKMQTHRLSDDTLAAARAYFGKDAPTSGPLLQASTKGGRLNRHGMGTTSITQRVYVLGERIGIEGLSAHDLPHHWATCAARNGTPLDRLMDAGGWASPATPMRYVEAAKIANEGVKLN